MSFNSHLTEPGSASASQSGLVSLSVVSVSSLISDFSLAAGFSDPSALDSVCSVVFSSCTGVEGTIGGV